MSEAQSGSDAQSEGDAGSGEPALAGVPRRIGDFELLEEIGRGGMGIVFRARQHTLDRIVALKVLKADVLIDASKVERFRREAVAVGKLDHPGIVRILTAGEDRGLQFFAMEWVDGHDLSVELRRLREGKRGAAVSAAQLPGPTSASYFQAVALLARAIAEALAHAHAHGIVHRDVKPSNVLIDRAGDVKLVDFGLARDRELGTITKTTEIAGTPHYMSPEQARALLHQVDERTDVYSLGVVLYELLTLRTPFQGRTAAELLDRIAYAEPPNVRRINPRVPRDLETICLQAMAKLPRDRYPSAAALCDDLERFLSHEAVHAQAPSPLSRVRRFVRRRRVALLALACIGVAGVAAIGVDRAAGRRRSCAAQLASLATARGTGAFAELPLSVLLDVRRGQRELATRRDELDADGTVLVDSIDAELAQLRGAWNASIARALAHARDPGTAEDLRESSRFTALQLLQRGAALFPDDDSFTQRSGIEAVFARLSVSARDADGRALAAAVRLRAIDPITGTPGAARELGRTPLVELPMLSGTYRVVIVFAEGGFREVPILLGASETHAVVDVTRAADDARATDGMAHFDACAFRMPDSEGYGAARGVEVELAECWIDKTEVSNAEYARFVEATGHRLPRYWESLPDRAAFLRDYGDRAVVYVSWSDAIAYAAWAGKRLATTAEWLRAAIGTEHRDCPWGPRAPGEPLRGNTHTPRPVGLPSEWHEYLQCVAPVTSHADACSPEGLYHLYGNVMEWTETVMVTQHQERSVQRIFDRMVLGGRWNVVLKSGTELPVTTPGFYGVDDRAAFLGFRCARSAEP